MEALYVILILGLLVYLGYIGIQQGKNSASFDEIDKKLNILRSGALKQEKELQAIHSKIEALEHENRLLKQAVEALNKYELIDNKPKEAVEETYEVYSAPEIVEEVAMEEVAMVYELALPIINPVTEEVTIVPEPVIPVKNSATTPTTSNEPRVIRSRVQTETQNFAPKPVPQEKAGFDFEELLGGNLLGKVGIAVLVLGIGFFVRYAIDEGWLNEQMRTLLGCLAGFLLIGLAHFKFKNYRLYSSLLLGGGFAAIFLSLGLGYQEYKVLSKEVTAGLLLLTTVGVYAFAVYYDRIEIGITAFLGGFALPFIASDGSGSLAILFAYYLILNVGTITLALQKNWTILLNISALFFWAIVGYIISFEQAKVEADRYVLVSFSLLFFLIYFLTALYITVKREYSLNVLYILVSNTLLSFIYTESLLYTEGSELFFKLVPAAYGIFILGFGLYFRRSNKMLATLLFTMAGSCLALTGPLAFEAENIFVYWFTLGMVIGVLNPILQLPYQKYVAQFFTIIGCLPTLFFLLVIQTNFDTYFIRYAYELNFIRAIYIIGLLWAQYFTARFFYGTPEEAAKHKFNSLYLNSIATLLLIYAFSIYSVADYQLFGYWPTNHFFLFVGIVSLLIALHRVQNNVKLTVNTIRFGLLPAVFLVLISQFDNDSIFSNPLFETSFTLGLFTFILLMGLQALINANRNRYEAVFAWLQQANSFITFLAIGVLWATAQCELAKACYYLWDFTELQFGFVISCNATLVALVYSYFALSKNNKLTAGLALGFGVLGIMAFLVTQFVIYRKLNVFGNSETLSLYQLGVIEYVFTILDLLLLGYFGYQAKALSLLLGSNKDAIKNNFRIAISTYIALAILFLFKNLAGALLLPDREQYHITDTILNALIPVLIGVAFIVFGFRKQIPMWRKIGLVYIALIIIKLHLIDVWGYTGVMKIVTFISLGVLLLFASFLFQRIKKVIE